MNNYVPMNMIPFIAKMDNAKPVSDDPKPGPTPTPFNPTELLHTVVPLELELVESHYVPEGSYIVTTDAETIEKLLLNLDLDEVGYGLPFRFTLDGKEYIVISHAMTSDTTLDLTEFIYADDSTGKIHEMRDWRITVETDTEDPQVIFTPGEIDQHE